MAEPTQFTYSHKELTTLLIKHQGLTEGAWTAGFQLGMGNTNVPSPTGEGMVPAVVVTILSVILQKADKNAPNAVDAAEVTPVRHR